MKKLVVMNSIFMFLLSFSSCGIEPLHPESMQSSPVQSNLGFNDGSAFNYYYYGQWAKWMSVVDVGGLRCTDETLEWLEDPENRSVIGYCSAKAVLNFGLGIHNVDMITTKFMSDPDSWAYYDFGEYQKCQNGREWYGSAWKHAQQSWQDYSSCTWNAYTTKSNRKNFFGIWEWNLESTSLSLGSSAYWKANMDVTIDTPLLNQDNEIVATIPAFEEADVYCTPLTRYVHKSAVCYPGLTCYAVQEFFLCDVDMHRTVMDYLLSTKCTPVVGGCTPASEAPNITNVRR